MSTRAEKSAERQKIKNAKMAQEIRAEFERRLAGLEKAGAEDHDIEAARVVFEMFQTAALISVVQFGQIGSDPGLIIAVFDRIMGQSETKLRTHKPYG